MAKKAKNALKKKQTKPSVPANALPQNILPVGERVEENKNIYISQLAYKEIHKFTKNKTTNESGGMLVGTVIEEFGKTNIVISGFVEAKYSEGTPTTLTFTHETWEYVHKEIGEKHSGKKIVGWIHTHPNFGIFLSEYDTFIQENFFSEEYQIAYVVDPIQGIEGFYFWINGKIERCKGFYIYDKTGVEITVDPENKKEKNSEEEKDSESTWLTAKNAVIALLCVIAVILAFAQISASSTISELNRTVEELEEQQDTLTATIAYMQQKISAQTEDIEELQELLGIIDDTSSTEETDETNNAADTSSDITSSEDTSSDDTSSTAESEETEDE